MLFLFASGLCFFLLQYILVGMFGAPMWLVVALQIAITLGVGTLVFRFVIFKEDEKIKEFSGYDNDSFTKFLHFKKDNVHKFEFADKHVNVFEYDNGTAMATICLKFGSNNNYKASQTKQMLEQIFKNLCNFNMEFRTISAAENFRNSAEFAKFIRTMNNVENKKLAAYVLTVTNNIVEISYEECNTDVLYICIKTMSSYQIDELEQMLRNIISILKSHANSFRSVEFLDLKQVTEFYKEFYTVEAIDLAMMRAIDIASDIDENYQKIVHIHSLYGENKIYRTAKADTDKILPNNERVVK